ncbi:MAG: thioesterase family protein [Syntrophorhabdales bacterium]|jgi:acyl-CoA thioesterase FadM
MPRVRLSEQEDYEFVYAVTVQIGHINYAGHLGHDALVGMVWEARVHLFDSLGVEERNLGDGRTGIIMQDLVVNFLGEAFLHQELMIESHIGEVQPRSFRMFHRISSGNKRIALMETGLAAFDYKLRKTAAVPDIFLKALEDHGAEPR